MIWKVKRTYADAAAATPLSPRAREELLRLLNVYGNPGALHDEARAAREELDTARERVARAIGAHADEIVFTSGGTEGNNLAVLGVLRPLLKEHGTLRAVVSSIEHSSVLEPLRALTKEGLELIELPVTSAGIVEPESVKDALSERAAFVSVQLVNSEVGTVEPVREIAKEIRRARKSQLWQGSTLPQTGKVQPCALLPLYFHCDASQAPLWKRIDVEKLGVDLLVLDGQKIMGPKGVGALYVRRGTALEAQEKGGGQERGLRSGTENVPLAGSFSVALEDAQVGVDERVRAMNEVHNFFMRELLRVLPNAMLNGAVGDERVSNNLNISIPGLDGEMAVIALNALGVAASTRSACDASDEAPSHVLVGLGLPPERIQGAIRLTLLPGATKKDASRITAALKEVAQRYGNMS